MNDPEHIFYVIVGMTISLTITLTVQAIAHVRKTLDTTRQR